MVASHDRQCLRWGRAWLSDDESFEFEFEFDAGPCQMQGLHVGPSPIGEQGAGHLDFLSWIASAIDGSIRSMRSLTRAVSLPTFWVW